MKSQVRCQNSLLGPNGVISEWFSKQWEPFSPTRVCTGIIKKYIYFYYFVAQCHVKQKENEKNKK